MMPSDAKPSASPPPHAAGRSLPAWLEPVLLTLLTWLTLITFPILHPLSLDPSWRMALDYFAQTDFQFGTDIVFTYGPLGYLSATQATDRNFTAHLLWQIGLNLPLAAMLVNAGRELGGLRKFFYYAFLLCLAAGFADVFQIIAILLSNLLLLQERVNKRPWLSAGIVAITGLLALVKFTNLMYALFAVACVVTAFGYQRQWRRAGLIAAAFVTTYCAGWLACGQSLTNIPIYFLNSLEVAAGYVATMGLQEPRIMFWYGVTSGLLLVVYLTLTLWRPENPSLALAAWAIAGAGGFLNWKHGYVRADGHMLAHFFYALFFVSLHGSLLSIARPFRLLQAGIAAGILAIAVLAISWMSPSTLLYGPGIFNERIVTNLRNLRDLAATRQKMIDEYHRMKSDLRMPSLQILGQDGRRVDVLGHEVGFAVVNDVNYHPRPTLQGYGAQNPHLADLNYQAYADPIRAPALVLSREETVDDRLPTLDDARVRRHLYHHYHYVMNENGFLVWMPNASVDASLDERVLIEEHTVGFGEMVETPHRGDELIYCEVDIPSTLLGKLRSFLYKPPPVYAKTDDGGSDQRRFLLPPDMARAGFLTYPYFSNQDNIVRYWHGELAPRLMRFSVETDEDAKKYFSDEIHVRFYAYPPIPRTGEPPPKPEALTFRPVGRIPKSVETDIGVAAAPGPAGAPERLLVHAPSALVFALDGNVRRVAGVFGLFEGAYTGNGDTDGVDFSIAWRPDAASAPTVLWQRGLAPKTEPGDRGAQPFAVTVPEGAGELILRTQPGNRGNLAYDWAYWTEVTFEP